MSILSEKELIEIPLKLYCELKGISNRTIYNYIKNKKIEVIDRNKKKYILVKQKDILIPEDFQKNLDKYEKDLNKNLKLIQRRKNKKILDNLKNIQSKLNKVIDCLDREIKVK